jgi:hypothetical protein
MRVEVIIEKHILDELKSCVELGESETNLLRTGVFLDRFNRIARHEAKVNPFTLLKAIFGNQQETVILESYKVKDTNAVSCPNCGKHFTKGKKALDGHMRVCKKNED